MRGVAESQVFTRSLPVPVRNSRGTSAGVEQLVRELKLDFLWCIGAGTEVGVGFLEKIGIR
jgi:hypothetical protein